MHYRLSIALIACGITGCMPWPHYRYYAPAVEGVVMSNGQPVSNADVKVVAQFSEEQRAAVTDSNGRFHTKPIKELQFFASLLGDPLFGYKVSIAHAAQQYEGFGEAHVGYPPKELQVTCDLSRAVRKQKTEQYCERAGSE